MNLYVGLKETNNSKPVFFPERSELKISNRTNDWYSSLYYFKEDHLKHFKTKNSISGIKDTLTDKLLFDFDCKDNVEQARQDAVTLCHRLIDEQGIPEESISAFFSGKKGVAIEVSLEGLITPEQFKTAVFKLASDLPTFDTSVNESVRFIRVVNTRHQDSKLYKIPLYLYELDELSVDQIRELASEQRHIEHTPVKVRLNEALFFVPEGSKTPATVKTKSELDIDFSKKIKGWSNCKWAMLQGYGIKPGERHEKLLSIVATCRALNFIQGQAYQMAKEAMKKGVALYGGEEASKAELWERVETVYSPTWTGGTYSCRDGKTPWLTSLCDSLGPHKCKGQDLPVVSAAEVFSMFENYATNFDKNVLNTGIKPLDDRAKLLVGNSNAILAPPGVGKSSLSFEILNHNSKAGVNSIFFSYDMFHSMVYLRLIQKHIGLQQDKVFDIFKHDKKRAQEIRAIIEREYKHVHFCFQAGQTAEEIQDTIRETQDKIQDKVKLVVIDYNELVVTNISDPTQSSAQVAQKMRQIANEEEVCVLSLLQPAKVFSNPADEITTYQGAKGSGAIAQSLSLMLSLSRPGFHPRRPEQDKFFTINALKHRQGPLFTIDMGWEGLTGKIKELGPEEQDELKEIRMRKESEKEKDSF